MRYLSVCSGIEAASVAWHPLGWHAHAFAEIEAFPSAVLAHHYPSVPNMGDMTKFRSWPDADFDVLVGGTPCQSFSVAGFRKGLADPRGNLMLTYLAIAERYQPRWVAWENVPGVFSVEKGRAFGAFLSGLAKLGYGFAYRVLDAQFFGLAQRRKRVFVVGYLGDWRAAAAVLFDRASLSGNPPPRRETRENVAATITGGARKRGGYSHDDVDLVAHSLRAEGFDASEDGTGRGTPLVPVLANTLTARMHKGINTTVDEGQTPIICFDETQITHPENRCNPRPGDPLHPLAAQGRPPTIAFNARQDPVNGEEVSGPLDTDGSSQAIAFSCKDYGADAGEIAPTLRAMGFNESHANGGGQLAIQTGYSVRRLTPRECERLQGFPDDYTLIPYRKKQAADSPRYKALGNSMAVPTMRWIGERIELVNNVLFSKASAESCAQRNRSV